VVTFFAKHYGGHMTPGASMAGPLDAITAKDHHALVAANLIYLNRGAGAVGDLGALMRTITAGGLHAALVSAFIRKYIGPKLAALEGDKFGFIKTADGVELVWVSIYGEPYIVTDVWMRMLFPRELFNGNGFPPKYILTGSKTSQTARCGNAVSPKHAAAMIRANTP
ncbi:MAG TPA: DNA cytosine methyltransferase, partial [Elusimicrobiota bacterium]|nr:DNA cytosine methyltransferase [Elusimicrobiota bacterium]